MDIKCGIVACALALAVAASAGAQELARVAPGDQLSLTVLGIAELSTKCVVDENGACTLTYLGAVPVVGRTAREVGADVTRLLKEKDIHRDPQVSVELIRVANLSVTVSGAVRTQGVQKFAGELSVFDALLRAGGADPDAADEILVVRADAIAPGATAGAEGDSVLRVSRRGLEAGDRAANIELHDGDHVIVPKAQQVFISGYVRSPGPYTIEAGMTLRQAVVLAGGISERGSDRRIDILRRDDAGKEEKVKDVTLSTPVKAGDTIIVKSRFF